MKKYLHYLLILSAVLLFISACGPFATERRFTDNPHALREPFLRAWHEAGGAELGPPLTDPIWLNGRLVQLFAAVRMEAGGVRGVAIHPQPVGWQERVPVDLLNLLASPYRAELTQRERDPAPVQPLTALEFDLRVADYSGPVEVRLYDALWQPAGRFAAQVADGAGTAVVYPRGQLGPQWALALIDGQIAAAYSDLFTLDAATTVATGAADLDLLYPSIRRFMEQAVTAYELNGVPVRGYRSPDNPLLWLRDHVYQGRGFRYFETDVTSLLAAFRAAQFADGSFPDVIDYPERFVVANRKEVESDLEFLFVQGVYEAWQMTGDEAILRDNLEAMRRGLRYITSDPLRWDAEFGLVRRPYTIDTWDFEYGPPTISPDGKPAPRHWIDENTIWGIFHGDNTGLAHAMELMARIEEQVGDPALAAEWRAQGAAITRRINELSWNGSFFTHFVLAEGPQRGQLPQVSNVDTAAQLSLSNTYALSRLGVDPNQRREIIATYFERRDFARAFAEWYSIDPPFPPGAFNLAGRPGDDPGEYVNGGIMPLVGGELARGAFGHGFEGYGFDILNRYAELIRLTGETYLWYYPDGRPGISGPDTIATDGWGSSAMLGALMVGAAGIDDRASRFEDIILSPRWAARPDLTEVRIVARYAASDGYVAYTWRRAERSLQLDLTGTWQQAYLRLLLPADAGDPQAVTLDGEPVEFTVGREPSGSRYVTLEARGGNAVLDVSW